MPETDIERWTHAFIDARAKGELKPVLAGTFAGATLADAFQVQKGLVAEISQTDPIAGYKAAVTAPAAQAAQGLKQALYGVLFDSGLYRPGAVVDSGHFRRCIMETEIGYRLKQDINELPAPDDLHALLEPIPMLEFAEVGYDNPANMGPLDLVAGNSASACYLAGERSHDVDLNQVSVSLSRQGELINEGRGSDAFGDQQVAVSWLIEQVLAAGYEIKAGHYLMTGALGRPVPLAPGDHIADFGDFGRIELVVS